VHLNLKPQVLLLASEYLASISGAAFARFVEARIHRAFIGAFKSQAAGLASCL